MCQSFLRISSVKCLSMPRSTVSRSQTLKESKGKLRMNRFGYNFSQVSSPKNTTFFPCRRKISIKLSSSISVEAKFDFTSTNVGKLPVVSPTILCIVVVGGSAINLNNLAFFERLTRRSWITVNLLMKNEFDGWVLEYWTKSKRKASIMTSIILKLLEWQCCSVIEALVWWKRQSDRQWSWFKLKQSFPWLEQVDLSCSTSLYSSNPLAKISTGMMKLELQNINNTRCLVNTFVIVQVKKPLLRWGTGRVEVKNCNFVLIWFCSSWSITSILWLCESEKNCNTGKCNEFNQIFQKKRKRRSVHAIEQENYRVFVEVFPHKISGGWNANVANVMSSSNVRAMFQLTAINTWLEWKKLEIGIEFDRNSYDGDAEISTDLIFFQ